MKFSMLLLVIVAFLPSNLKIWILRLIGHKIGKNCYIGLSIVNASKINMENNVYIGHFNLIWRLTALNLRAGSRITFFNWITGGNFGAFMLGNNSSISRRHFFDASAGIDIEENTIVAGIGSQFFTHGISPSNLNERKPICIGSWSYIGSGSYFVPGSSVSSHCFVGMGSVVTKPFTQSYRLIAGSPAQEKKEISQESKYFDRHYVPQPHHPNNYTSTDL